MPNEIPLLGAADHKLLVSDVLQSTGKSGSEIMALPYMNQEVPVLKSWGYEGNQDYTDTTTIQTGKKRSTT